MKSLEQMKIFLSDIDEKKFKPKISDDNKLYILNPLDKYREEILKKVDELELRYCMSREPVFGLIDPNTLERPLTGFTNYQYWFEMLE